MKIQMLVLANSKKAGGRCLAGINTQTLELIRPVTEQLHYEIPAIYTLNKKTNNQIRPLDLIEIELKRQNSFTKIKNPDGLHLDMQKQIGIFHLLMIFTMGEIQN